MTKVPFVPKNNSTTNENSLLFSKIDEILDHESLEIKENVSDNRIGGKLSEFFYPPEYYDEMHMNSVFQIRAGDEWPIQVLRALDVAELQELWFVLLVERNRLFAARFEYLRNQITLPSMQRLDNIAKSMDNLRTVLEQTEKAKNMLYKGRSEEITGEYNTNSFGDAEWVRHREHPVPKEGQYEHLQKYVFETTHPDAKIPHHNVREFQLRQEEQKYMEMNEFYKNLRQKWNSYRNARPEDKTLSEEPPEWWLGMKENQPKFRNDMWITNMPLVSDEYKEKKKISVNVPGDPNI